MAKKPRKKSKGKKPKGKKKTRRDEKSGRDASPSGDETPAEADADSPDDHTTDDAAEESEDEDDAADPQAPDPQAAEDEADKGSEKVAAVIDVDQELDDPEARAELIAAAAGLTDERAPEDDEAEGVTDTDIALGSDGDARARAEDPAERGTDDDASDDEGSDDPGSEDGDSEDENADDEGSDDEDSEDEGETLLIGRTALAALNEFREEGVATMREEIVLDLGETVPEAERDRLLAAALAQVQMQEAIYRVPIEAGAARRWKGLIAALVLVMALFIAGLPPSFLVPEGPAALSLENRLRGARVSLLVQADQIEAFRVREDRLPESLEEVRTALPGIRFIRSNDRVYQLIAYLPDGEPVVYDSASPDPVFGEVARSWVMTRDDS